MKQWVIIVSMAKFQVKSSLFIFHSWAVLKTHSFTGCILTIFTTHGNDYILGARWLSSPFLSEHQPNMMTIWDGCWHSKLIEQKSLSWLVSPCLAPFLMGPSQSGWSNLRSPSISGPWELRPRSTSEVTGSPRPGRAKFILMGKVSCKLYKLYIKLNIKKKHTKTKKSWFMITKYYMKKWHHN